MGRRRVQDGLAKAHNGDLLMATDGDLTINFASAGNSLAYLGGGWARSEADFTWGIGAESQLVLPRLEAADDTILTLDVVPFVHAPELPRQRLIVSVNDTVVGSTALSRPTLLGYRIPASARRAERVLVTLRHPDAARPKEVDGTSDDRSLAFALREAKLFRLAGTDAADDGGLPAGLMLGAASRQAPESNGQADVTAWATKRTRLSLAQIALRFESLGGKLRVRLVPATLRRGASGPAALFQHVHAQPDTRHRQWL